MHETLHPSYRILYFFSFVAQNDIKSVIPILATFCSLFGRLISTLHDGEFCQEDVLPGAISKIMPFTLPEIATVSTVLKDISLGLVDLAFPETRSSINEHYRAVLKTNSHGAAEDSFNKIMWPHLMKVHSVRIARIEHVLTII